MLARNLDILFLRFSLTMDENLTIKLCGPSTLTMAFLFVSPVLIHHLKMGRPSASCVHSMMALGLFSFTLACHQNSGLKPFRHPRFFSIDDCANQSCLTHPFNSCTTSYQTTHGYVSLVVYVTLASHSHKCKQARTSLGCLCLHWFFEGSQRLLVLRLGYAASDYFSTRLLRRGRLPIPVVCNHGAHCRTCVQPMVI